MNLKKCIAVLCIMSLLFSAISMNSYAKTAKSVSLFVPENWEMLPGESRSLEYTFSPDDTTERGLKWSSSDESVAKVDKWGRVSALKTGSTTITAVCKTAENVKSSVKLNVVNEAAALSEFSEEENYLRNTFSENEVSTLQKFVDRYTLAEAKALAAVPSAIKDCIAENNTFAPPAEPQTSTETKDCSKWTVEAYGVKRVNNTEKIERNKVQRFMGNRYLSANEAPVTAIASDGGNGIWTVMAQGVTHIRMEALSLEDKAIMMSDNTQKYVARNGMTSNASWWGGDSSYSSDNDNDGLWTSMYGAGEIFRYGTLRDELVADPNNTELQKKVSDAKKVATQSAEAVLLLSNISCRTGTTEAYVRYNPAATDPVNDPKTSCSNEALLEGHDLSLNIPSGNVTLSKSKLDSSFLAPFNFTEGWRDTSAFPNENYEKRTRSLSGFIARTYVLDGSPQRNHIESNALYFDITGNEATCITAKPLKNGEALNGVKVDASGEIPARLMKLINTATNPNTGKPFTKDDIVYKGDTSSDEIIGHLFIYKIAYDILGPDDPELKQIITATVRKFAQHLVDNNYNLVDATGQPTMWAKYGRDWLFNYQSLTDASINSLILLDIFKLAAHVTGEERWEREYRMLALDEAYGYADLACEYWDRWEHAVKMMAEDMGIPTFLINNKSMDYLIRLFQNYSGEEMHMLAFYIIFQLEDDELLLKRYRTAIDERWKSAKYSENPLWYYIYQLAYPEKYKTDAYGNSVLETAAWTLSRHPIDTRRFRATSTLRDDLATYDIAEMLGMEEANSICYDIQKSRIFENQSGIMSAVTLLLGITKLEYAIAAPDERSMHKYNVSSYRLEGNESITTLEASTTYTLPYWMGRYHGMLQENVPEKSDKKFFEKLQDLFDRALKSIKDYLLPFCELIGDKTTGFLQIIVDVLAPIIDRLISI